MFLSCNTYRAAASAPDSYFVGGISFQTTAIDNTSNVQVQQGQNVTQYIFPGWSHETTQSLVSSGGVYQGDVSFGLVATTGATTSAFTTGSIYAAVIDHSTAGFFYVSVDWSQISNTATTFRGVLRNAVGSTNLSTTLAGGTTTRGSYTTQVPIAQTQTTSVQFIVSTLSLTTNSQIWTISTSASSSAISNSSATQPTVTTALTITSMNTFNISSTSTSTAKRMIWTTAGGSAITTTAAATTTVTHAASESISFVSTFTTTTASPSWFGGNSDQGTVFIAFKNIGTDDLPAWLVASIGTSALWNYSYSTMFTLWQAPPTGFVNAIATQNFTAVSVTNTTFSLATVTTITAFGTSSYTTTTSSTAAQTFTQSTGAVTVPLPLATIQFTLTSYTMFTATITNALMNPANTTTTLASGSIVTIFISTSSCISSRGTYQSAVSMTTLGPGYTTASWAYGIGNSTLFSSTTILTASHLSIMTTTLNQTFARLASSSPTAVVTTTTSAHASTSTLFTYAFTGGTSVTPVTVTWLSTMSSTIGGTSEQFTNRVYAGTYAVSSNLQMMSTTAGPIYYAPGSVAWWSPIPFMQGFSPLTNTSVTYQGISAASILNAIPLMALRSGSFVSFDSTFGRQITSTAWGVWMLALNPSETTTTTTYTSAGSTLTSTYTEIAFLTWSYTSTASTGTQSGSSASILLGIPSNGDQAGATVYQTISSTGTATTTGSPTSTITSSSATASDAGGITYSNPITNTFVESYAYTSTDSITAYISVLGQITFVSGTASTVYPYVTTTTTLSTTTYSTLSTPTSAGVTPSSQHQPGVGGHGKFAGAPDTIYCIGAAVSLIGFGTASTTWSSADPNFFQVVIGGSFTTTSSTTSASGGLGSFAAYTIPGQASLISSPALFVTTQNGPYAIPITTATGFWKTPDPALTPPSWQR